MFSIILINECELNFLLFRRKHLISWNVFQEIISINLGFREDWETDKFNCMKDAIYSRYKKSWFILYSTNEVGLFSLNYLIVSFSCHIFRISPEMHKSYIHLHL